MKRHFLICLALLLLSSCTQTNVVTDADMPDGPEQVQETEAPAETAPETTTEDYLNTLPQKDYSGTTFTMIGKNDVEYAHNFPEAQETGEIVNDALFYRNRTVEERYGVAFAYELTSSGGDTVSKVQADVMAGDMSYDMIQGSMLTCTNVLLNRECLFKINDLPAIDLSQPWWNSRCGSDLAIAGNFYYITGDIMYEHYREAACLLFNKNLMKDYNIDTNLYQLVQEGKWTFDKMQEVASAIEGNSGTYRYTISDIGGYDFYFGGDLRITYFDENGNPYFANTPTNKMSDLIDKYSNVFADTSICVNDTYNYSMGTLDSVGRAKSFFTSGNALFYSCRTEEIMGMRDNDIDFGVVPVPKYDQTQENYISYANPWVGSSVAFPKNMQNAEMSGIITEALACESMSYLKPAMYDNMLKTRSTRDEESAAMLDIIFSTKTFDLCDICEWGQLNYAVRDNVLGVKDTLASDYATIITAANNALTKTVALFTSENTAEITEEP